VGRIGFALRVDGAGRRVLEVGLDDVADDRDLLAVDLLVMDPAPKVVRDAPDRICVTRLLRLRRQRRHAGHARLATTDGGLWLVRILIAAAPKGGRGNDCGDDDESGISDVHRISWPGGAPAPAGYARPPLGPTTPGVC